MAEYTLVDNRNISGKGVLRIPPGIIPDRYFILFATVFRKPTNQYLNLSYNPPRSRYGNLTFFRRGYLIATQPIEYPKQVFDTVNDITGQNLIAIKCAYKGTLQSYVNLGLALGVTPVSVTDAIRDYDSLDLAWDEVKLVCYGDGAINLQLWRLGYDVCDPTRLDEIPQIDPETPPADIPPGTPFEDISDPYEDGGDGGDTQPNPIDESAVPPSGEPCVQYNVVFSYVNQASERVEESRLVYGQVGRIRTVAATGEQHQVQMEFQGFPASESCGAFQYRRLTGANEPNRYDDPVIESITEA